MSEENVEVMRRAFDAFSRRDRDAWLELCDPEFEVVPAGDWPEPDPIRGPDAAWDFLVATDEPWERSDYELNEIIDIPGEKVVAHQRREMQGKSSGAGVQYDYWVVLTFRDGRALRVEWFGARGEALEAAGLSE